MYNFVHKNFIIHFSARAVLSLSAAFCVFLRLSANFHIFSATFSEILHKFPSTFIEMLHKFTVTFCEMLHKKADTKCVGFAQISRNKMSKFRNDTLQFIGTILTIFIDYFLRNPQYFIVHFSALLFAHFPADRHGLLRGFPSRFDIKCHSNSGGMPRIGMPKSKTTPKK